MGLILGCGGGVDENVIKVNNDKMVDEGYEPAVDMPLEDGSRVCQAKGHDKVLKQTAACAECCFPFVSFGCADAVIGQSEFNFGEDASVGELVRQDVGQR